MQAGSNYYTTTAWDGIGRVKNAYQTTNGQSYPFAITYLPYLVVQSITYPNSGRVVTTGYDSGGRPSTLTGQLPGQAATNYVTNTTYQPHGAIAQQTLAGGAFVATHCNGSQCDNSRLQATYLQVGSALTLQYSYSPAQNNGNLLSQTITRGSQSWTQSYGYAESTGWSNNRLACANEVAGLTPLPCGNSGSAWTQTYGYDKPGNRWLISAGPSNPTAELITGPSGTDAGPFDGANRVGSWDSSTCWNGANCYDPAGNLLAIPAGGGAALRTATYDAENRMISATTSNGVPTVYVYDGDGRRVLKAVCPAGTPVNSCGSDAECGSDHFRVRPNGKPGARVRHGHRYGDKVCAR